MLVADRPQAGGRPVQGFLPARLAEVRERIAGIEHLLRVLADAVLADQRPGQAVRVADVVEAEAALDAQTISVGRTVPSVDVRECRCRARGR